MGETKGEEPEAWVEKVVRSGRAFNLRGGEPFAGYVWAA